MSKLIFFDIDGTIIAPGQVPSQSTIEAIQSARANGHKVFLSTGRREADVPENVRSIGFDGGIYSAGGRVVVDGIERLNHPMPVHLVQQVIDIMREWNLYFILESASGTYVGAKDQTFPSAIKQMICILEAELDVINQKRMPERDDIYKIVFLAESKTQAEHLIQKLNSVAKIVCFGSLFPDYLAVIGEISDRNTDKGTALTCICQCLGADLADCIAFGDSMNDAEILQAAGIGIAMGNAEERVKELADQVCERCNEDGIAKALVRLGLI